MVKVVRPADDDDPVLSPVIVLNWANLEFGLGLSLSSACDHCGRSSSCRRPAAGPQV
jgi:hypothetical protein